MGLLAKIPFWSNFWGRILINSIQPSNKRKTKTAPAAYPSAGEIAPDIVEQFVRHQEVLSAQFAAMKEADVDAIRLHSPLLSLITYSLRDLLNITVLHEQRHIEQAKRVMENENFPRNLSSFRSEQEAAEESPILAATDQQPTDSVVTEQKPMNSDTTESTDSVSGTPPPPPII